MNTNYYTILCVDDDPDDLELLHEALQRALKTLGSNYSILEAHNGEDALAKLKEMKKNGTLPCLVVLDINMPKVDGKQTLLSMQSDSELSAVPVVILSTSSSQLDKMFFEKRHVEFITKPFSITTLSDVAARLLRYCKQ
jgi:CheY-like chemotaxis protein